MAAQWRVASGKWRGDLFVLAGLLSAGMRRATSNRFTSGFQQMVAELAIRRLHEIASDSLASFDERIDRLLRLGCERLGLQLAALVRGSDHDNEDYEFHFYCLDESDANGPWMKAACALFQSHYRRTLDSDSVVALEGMAGSAPDHPQQPASSRSAYLGVPVRVRQRPVGALGFISTDSREIRFGEADKDLAQLLAWWLGWEIERQENDRGHRFAQFALDRTDDLIFWITPDGRLTDVNAPACRSLGYTRDQLLRMSVRDIDIDYSKEAWDDLWGRIKREGSVTLPGRHRTKDGRIRPVQSRSNWLRYGELEFNCSIVRDATHHWRGEALYRNLTGIANDAILVAEFATGKIVDANQRAEELLGCARQLLLEMNLSELTAPGETELSASLPGACENHAEQVVIESVFVDRQHQPIPVEISASVIEVAGERLVQGIVRDIRDRKQAEATLRRADRLSSVGTVAAGIAHEINNPISAAWAAAQTALDVLQKPDKTELLSDALGTVINSVKRCDQIVQNVLRFSRDSQTTRDASNINDIVQRAVEFTQPYAARNWIYIDCQLAEKLPLVNINRVELEQVVVNLLRNAIQASMANARIVVRSSATEHKISFSIADQGRGLSASGTSKVFDPFFTGRPEGLGLGMSIVRGIVQDHNGEIDVQSEEGAGTTVTVSLPVDNRERESRATNT